VVGLQAYVMSFNCSC